MITSMNIALPRPAAPLDESAYTLTIDAAADRYAAAGFPRPARRLQKYCARGDLECRKVETSSGERYIITPESVDRHIAYIKETSDAAGRAPARPDAPERATEVKQEIVLTEDAAEPVQPRPLLTSRFSSTHTCSVWKGKSMTSSQNMKSRCAVPRIFWRMQTSGWLRWRRQARSPAAKRSRNIFLPQRMWRPRPWITETKQARKRG